MKLRVLEESDLEQLRDWRNSARLRQGFRGHGLLNMINQHDWFEHVSRTHKVEMFGIEVDGALVGVCGLCYIDWINGTAEVSMYVAPDLQHTDVAVPALQLLHRKAFNESNLRRLWAEVYEFHTLNIALFEKCGYVLEGRLRKHTYKQGQYHDSLMYGFLR